MTCRQELCSCSLSHVIECPLSDCLADPGEIHTGEADLEGWTYTLQIPIGALTQLHRALDERREGPPDFPVGVIEDPRAVARLATFFRVVRSADPLERESRLLAALGHLVRVHGADRARNRPHAVEPGLARSVRDYLADHLAEAVTLADLEQATGTGRYRLLRAFARAYGLPPHAWLVQARLERAHALIARGIGICEAAAVTGFADQPHLTRLFKRAYGYTPGVLARSPRIP
ncbi:DNA-binding domain-containing protein, AraC-type [Thioflavicoccus mobilis 8321]|uniref:DNA-binding domain-containing protein, AraC-type n=1 Tax=Thioflavicoccus mobilis 8321 TaxID=765912 RepID=L0H190_9GAMM|nr:AraC family transcriptional regulator [Thioflavicoccus mobilis]AGA91827.1 DNA-binding domain-containing protein, AraC-type [Thioflavicoccus mobilis 8321]